MTSKIINDNKGFIKGNIYESTGTYVLCTETSASELIGTCIHEDEGFEPDRLGLHTTWYPCSLWILFKGTIAITG